MDDFSRFILSRDLNTDMTGGSTEDVVQQAIDFTGMTDVPAEDRTVLLSDNGAGYIFQHLNDYYPQTNGKMERYHVGLGNVTPCDVYTGRHLETIQKRKEAKSRTSAARRDYNRSLREEHGL